MRQNAPNLISISIFFRGNTPEPPPLRLPPNPRGGEGKQGSERAGEGKGEVCVIAVGGIDASGNVQTLLVSNTQSSQMNIICQTNQNSTKVDDHKSLVMACFVPKFCKACFWVTQPGHDTQIAMCNAT